MEDGATAERFGAKRVLADSLQDMAEGRVRHTQEQQGAGREDDEAKIVNQILPVITMPKALSWTRLSLAATSSGTLMSGRRRRGHPLRAAREHVEGRKQPPRRRHGEEIDCTRGEKRPIRRASAAAAMRLITSALEFLPTA
jgi:hypothetical protein